MKWLLILLFSITILFTTSSAQTSFCITVNDVCCTGGASTGTYQMQPSDNFSTWYIFYDTGSKADKVTVTAKLDGVQVWQESGLCGCGTKSVNYPTANEHLITIEVECTYCSMPPCASGTAVVQVYTPSTNGCRGNCIID